MKKTAHFLKVKGLTLIESVLVLAILGILLGLSTPYLLGTKEKAILEIERDKIVNALKIGQQKAIAAYKGYDYKIRFDSPQTYTLQPETENKVLTLHPKIEISSPTPSEIIFARLTGKPNTSLILTLESQRFKCDISVSSEGVMTTTNPERK